MRPIRAVLLLTVLTATFYPDWSRAAEGGWRGIGLRTGVNTTDSVTLHQYEVFTSYQLPWEVRSASGWALTTRVNGAAGWLHGADVYGSIVSAGPGLGLERDGLPVEVNAGVSVAFLSQDTFGAKDLNGLAQFLSHIGLNLRLVGPFAVGYDFQHMSNASMNGNKNPGVNLHMFSLFWNFNH